MMWAPIANNVVSIARPAAVPGHLRPDRHQRRLQPGPGGAARHRLHRRGRRSGGDPGAVPALVRLPLPAAVRLPAHRARPHPPAGQVGARLRAGHPARADRGEQGGHRRDDPSGRWRRAGGVRLRVRDLDPAALADHRLAGHGDAAERLPAGGGRRPGGGGRRGDPDDAPGPVRAGADLGRVRRPRAADRPADLRLRRRCRGLAVHRLRADGTRHRAGAVHPPVRLPARLLRAGEHQDTLPHPDRHRRRERGHRGRRRGRAGLGAAGGGRAGAGLLPGVRAGRRDLLPAAAEDAARPGPAADPRPDRSHPDRRRPGRASRPG